MSVVTTIALLAGGFPKTRTSLSCFESELSVLFHLLCSLCQILFCWGHATSHIKIFLSLFNSKIKSDLLNLFYKIKFYLVAVFRKWNSKSHTSFALSFSSTVSLSHHCSYQMAS